jgi:hypothetical protein
MFSAVTTATARHVGRRDFARRQIHARVDEGRDIRDVLRVERAPNRVALALDVDVDDARLGHPATG